MLFYLRIMLTAFLLLFQLGFAAAAEIPLVPRAGHYTLGADVSYFKTDSNYSTGGGSYDGIGGDLTNLRFDLGAAYDFTREIRAAARLGISSVTANGTPGSTSNSGLNDIGLAAQYWWRSGALQLVPQADLTIPVYKVDAGASDAIIGEGALELAGGSWLLWRSKPWTPFGYLAFKYRDGGRSYVLPYSFGVNYSPGGWWTQAELRGYRTVVDDADTDNRADRDVVLNNANAGSQIYYSINPSVMEAALSAGVKIFNRWQLHGGLAQTLDGASSAHGMTVSLGLIFGSRPAGRSRVDAPEEDFDQFEIPNVKYDESVFEESNVLPGKQKQPPAKVRKKKKKPVNVDKMIQDTERSLERRK